MRVLLLLLGLLALIASISSASLGKNVLVTLVKLLLGSEETMVQLGGYRSGRPAMYSPQAGILFLFV